MSFYNMLFGMNWQSDLLLAVIGLKKNDVERFRDCHKSEDGSEIYVYTRTGGGNREDYPNLTMRERPEWRASEDDGYDCTYCTDTFEVPEQWREDVKNLGDMTKGFRAEFAQHLAATINRAPTERDAAAAAYEAEEKELGRTAHFKANGHTFVPKDDTAMETALKLAEANGGSLRSCWGIMPLNIEVKRDFVRWPGAKDENERKNLCRVEVNYDFGWGIDNAYWEHCRERFASKYPLAMAKIAEDVETYRKKRA